MEHMPDLDAIAALVEAARYGLQFAPNRAADMARWQATVKAALGRIERAVPALRDEEAK